MYYLDGVDDQIHLEALADVGDFTIAFKWANFDTGVSQMLFLISEGDAFNGMAFLPWIYGPASKIFMYTGATGGDATFAQVTTGAMHHGIIRRSGTTAELLIDGVSIHTATVDAGTVDWANIAISGYMLAGAPGGQFCNCLLYEFGIWGTRFDDTQVAAHAAGTDPYTLGVTNLLRHLDLTVDPMVDLAEASDVTVFGSPDLEASMVTAGARLRAGWPKIGAAGGTLFLLMEDLDGELTNFAGQLDHPSIKINGGSPITLSQSLVSPYASWVTYPLNPVPDDVMIDEEDDACTLTGTWAAGDLGSFFSLHWAGPSVDGRFHYTLDPDATAVYDFGTLAAGDYELQAITAYDYDRTTQARFVIAEGETPIGSPIDVDQTATPSHDDNGHHYKWTRLGTFTTTGGAITVTVTNEDADPERYLTLDALRCKQLITPLVQPGDTVTCTIPPITFSTVAGFLEAITDAPVTIETDATQFPYDADGPHTLKIGENFANSEYSIPNRFYANLFYYGYTWEAKGGAVLAYDGDTFEMTAASVLGAGYAEIIARASWWQMPGIDGTGLASFGPGTYTFFYTAVETGEGPFTITPFTAFGSNFTVENISVHESLGGDRYKFTFDLVEPYNGLYGYRGAVGFQAYGLIKDCVWYDPDTPDDWPYMTHPYVYEALHGTGIDCIRPMGSMATPLNNCSRFSDMTRGALSSKTAYPVRQEEPAIASFRPVDLSVDDLDGAIEAFADAQYHVAYVITTTAPHGFRPGEGGLVGWISTDETTYDDTNGGNVNVGGSTMDNAPTPVMFWYLSATELLCYQHWNDGGPAHAPFPYTVPTTLTTTHTPNATLHSWSGIVRGGSESMLPLPRAIQVCNECGVNFWLCIPFPMEDPAELALLADYVAANLDPSLKVYVEYYNEQWNPQFLGLVHMFVRGRQNGLSNHQWYTHQASIVHTIFRDQFVAADRPATDVIRVIATQGEFIGADGFGGFFGPSASIVTYAQANGIEFDLFSPAIYDHIRPLADYWGLSEDVYGSIDRMTVGDMLDITPYTYKYNGHVEKIGLDRQLLDSCGFTDVSIGAYEASWEALVFPRNSYPIASEAWNIDNYQRLTKGWAIFRDPRMYLAKMHMLQTYEDNGVTLYNQLAFANVANVHIGTYWCERVRFNDPPGRGDGSDGKYDNRINPFNQDLCVTPVALAHLDWAGMSIDMPATTYTIATAATGFTGFHQAVEVTLDHPGTAVVTLASADGTFDDATLSFADEAGPLVAYFTPAAAGTATISGTNDAGLDDPADVDIDVSDPGPPLSGRHYPTRLAPGALGRPRGTRLAAASGRR